MTTRMFIGEGPSGGVALRIMKNPADDPATTPRTQYNKFAFDSESGDLAYAYGINADPASVGYIPVITSMASYESGWWEFQDWWTTTYDWGGRIGKTPFAGVVQRNNPALLGPGQFEWSYGSRDIRPQIADVHPSPLQTKYLLWQLPATNSALPFPSSSGGVSRFYKEGSALRLPRASFAINNANPRNFILHESIRPAKVISAGRIRLNSGGPVAVTLPGPTSSNVFVGGHFNEPGGAAIYPYNSTNVGIPSNSRRVQFRVLDGGRTLQFRERAGHTVDVSYYVVAEDGSGQTTGNASVIRSGVDSLGESYIQIRRPGCAEPPNFADILVDSRWQTMPLIAHGFVPKSSFASIGGGGYQATVSVPTLGYKPLVLPAWWLHSFTEAGVWAHDRFYEGFAAYGTNLGAGLNINQYLGDTAFAIINDGSITFRHYMFNPNYYGFDGITGVQGYYYGGGTNDVYRTINFFVGVRYYVFAIPQG